MPMPDLFINSSLSDAEAVDFLNNMFWEAAEHRVQDIQLRFDRQSQKLIIQQVSDTVKPLLNYKVIDDPDLIEKIDIKIRSRAHIDVADNKHAIDGKIHLVYRESDWGKFRKLDIRLSIVPTVQGQTFVLRIQEGDVALMPLSAIETTRSAELALRHILDQNQGIVIVCGPTGSGKTTLLYSLLLELKKRGKNIKTIEKPPEYTVDGIDQIAVTRNISFSDGIRAFMRQRPHVILVGEVRDEEEAEALVQAGRTGHLVFCTVHADSSAEAFTRLIGLGIDAQTICDSVKMVISQRLHPAFDRSDIVEMQAPDQRTRFILSNLKQYFPTDNFPKVPATPLPSKVPVMEILTMTPNVKRALKQSSISINEVFKAASFQAQFETLTQATVRLARQGRTTLESLKGLPFYDFEYQRIDQLLVQEKLIRPEQAFEAVENQARETFFNNQMSLWESIISLELATLEQIIDTLGKHDLAPKRALYLLERGYLTSNQINEITAAWREINQTKSLFKMLVETYDIKKETVYNAEILYYGNRLLEPVE